MASFVISTRSNGEFQFVLKAGNGQTVLTSEGYAAKAGCLNGIESVKKNGQDAKNFDLKNSSNGKFYFTLKAGNGQIIGTSQMYESESGRDGGVDSIIQNASTATIAE